MEELGVTMISDYTPQARDGLNGYGKPYRAGLPENLNVIALRLPIRQITS